MFESPVTRAPYSLTLESFAPGYGLSSDIDEEELDEASHFEIDPFVESGDWSTGLTPTASELPDPIAFVDGVQRIEYWAQVSRGEASAKAALASVAVGATVVEEGRARVECGQAHRVIAAAVEVEPQSFITTKHGLLFEGRGSTKSGYRAVFQTIAIKRRDLEQELVQRLLHDTPLVFVDGRLDRPGASANLVVGIAKTLSQLYVSGEQAMLVHRLQAGERTPLFSIADSWGSRFSWFLKLPFTRPLHHSLAGVVRLETPNIGSHVPVEVANMVSFNLPRFASRPEHDPRAPQNLLPVGALEKRLRHEMGDTLFIRRAIEDHLMQEYANV